MAEELRITLVDATPTPLATKMPPAPATPPTPPTPPGPAQPPPGTPPAPAPQPTPPGTPPTPAPAAPPAPGTPPAPPAPAGAPPAPAPALPGTPPTPPTPAGAPPAPPPTGKPPTPPPAAKTAPTGGGLEDVLKMVAGGQGAMLAAAGPAGIAIAAAMKIKEDIKEGIRAAGEVGGRAASLDTGAMFDGMNKTLEQFGPFGEYLSEANKAVKAFADGLSYTAKRLSAFSGPLASAEAMANVAQIQGDIRRAELLGPELAEFVAARSKLEQSAQNALAQMIKPLIPGVTKLIEYLTVFLENFGKGFEALSSVVIDQLNAMITGINLLIYHASLGTSTEFLKTIAKNTEPKENKDATNYLLDELLDLSPAQMANLFAPEQKRTTPVDFGGPAFGGI